MFCAQVRSSLLAAVTAVQEHARSCGVSIVVEDAGAGLRKSVPPGDEVRVSVLPAPPLRNVMRLQAKARRMVDAAAALSASSFFVSAVLNESGYRYCSLCALSVFTSHSYGEYILPSTISLQTCAQIAAFASEHPLLCDAAPSLLKSLDRAYARNAAGPSMSTPSLLPTYLHVHPGDLILRRVLSSASADDDGGSAAAKASAAVFSDALACLIITAFLPATMEGATILIALLMSVIIISDGSTARRHLCNLLILYL